MLRDEKYTKWLNLTAELVNEYNLKRIIICSKEIYPIDVSTNKIIPRNVLYIRVTDIYKILIDDSRYDILE